MGHRLSRIYTRTGDSGTTGLGDGSRVDKDHARIEALGTVDELNSALGLLLSEPLPHEIKALLTGIQHRLFDLGGELSVPGRQTLTDREISELEHDLEKLNDTLDPLDEFVLPGGTGPAALCHLARSICRRAERRVFALSKVETVSLTGLRYLNRLSDLLFVIARCLNMHVGVKDTLWQPLARKGP